MIPTEPPAELYLCQLRDLFGAESQIALTIEAFAECASSAQLRALLLAHDKHTETQKDRIRHVFDRYSREPGFGSCRALLGLIRAGHRQIEQTRADEIRDHLIVAHCLKIKNYEVAGYRFVVTLARRFGLTADVARFGASLEEEREIIRCLAGIAPGLPMSSACSGQQETAQSPVGTAQSRLVQS